jgi:hypothetical protein
MSFRSRAPTTTAAPAQGRLHAVLSAGHAHAAQRMPTPVGMLAVDFDNPFTVIFRIMCSNDSFDSSVVVDRATVDRARAGEEEPPVTVAPGALNMYHNFPSIGRELTFLSGRVSEGEKSYTLRSTVVSNYRDGGSTLYKFEMKHPTKEKWFPVNLTVGGKETVVKLTFA